MIARDVLRHYRKLRAPYCSPILRPIVAPAKGCLSHARELAEFDAAFEGDSSGAMVSDCGRVRLRIEPDDECRSWDELFGDSFDPLHAGDVPGGLRTLKAQEKEARARIERDGVWGFVVETVRADKWEHSGSCWGFDSLDYCRTEGIAAAVAALREERERDAFRARELSGAESRIA